MNQYDLVLIDVSPTLSNNNKAVLEECDEALCIVTQDNISNTRLRALIKELDIINKRNNVDILDKTKIILNKYIQGFGNSINCLDEIGKSVSVRIPKVGNLLVSNDGRYRINLSNKFGSTVDSLIDMII